MDLFSILFYAIPGMTALIVIHELGHLSVALFMGISVEAFSVFFGSPILKFKWKGIEWRLGWLPFGGYCKLKGQEDFGSQQSSQDPDSFYARPAYARLLTVLAGPGFNLILGILLFVGVFYWGGTRIIPNAPVAVTSETSFLHSGDTFLKIEDVDIHSWNDVEQAMSNFLLKDTLHVIVDRNGVQEKLIYSQPLEKRIRRDFGFQLQNFLRIQNVLPKIAIDQDENGVVVEMLNPNKKSDLRPFDIVIAINDIWVKSGSEFGMALKNKSKDGKHKLLILRGVPEQAEILSINGESFGSVSSWKGKSLQNKKYSIEILENNRKKNIDVRVHQINIVALDVQRDNKEIQIAGIAWSPVLMPFISSGSHYRMYSMLESVQLGFSTAWSRMKDFIFQFQIASKLNFSTFKDSLSGPIGIVRLVGVISESGLLDYIKFLAMLSCMLTMVNLIPLPPIDGWHIVLIAIEMIRGRPLSLKIVDAFQRIGVILLLSLAIFVTWNDIAKIFG